MSVEQLLTKIQDYNAGVRGCVFSSGQSVHHSLTGNYEIIDSDEFAELADRMLDLGDAAPELDGGSDTAFLEYESHSVFMRRVDEGVLVVLTDPMNMTGFKKINVGINLFLKPLTKAAKEPQVQAQPAAVSAPATSGAQGANPMLLRANDPILRQRAAPVPEAPAAQVTPPEPPVEEVPRYARSESAEAPVKKKKRFYRGVEY